MTAIEHVDPELCTCYKPGWWAKRLCVNGWGPCYYTARLANVTPLSVAHEYVRRNIAVGNTFEDACHEYYGSGQYGGRLRFDIGGYLFPLAGIPKGEQPRWLKRYEMYVRVDDQEAVFDLRTLWREATSGQPHQLALL